MEAEEATGLTSVKIEWIYLEGEQDQAVLF
ncbi:MAG: hypothetical protein ACLUVG_05345 [Phocaeicola vulgatus]